jgi:hypothetical protein
MDTIVIDSKFSIVIDWPNNRFEALRYGASWRNMVGDNLVLSMVYRIQELEKKIRQLEKKGDDVDGNSGKESGQP